MTIVREYGPFKGIHKSTTNLISKQGYVLDAQNVVVNQDNGDIEKRPGVRQLEVLASSFGITRHINTPANEGENLFLAGLKCRYKDTVASASVQCNDFLGANNFPAMDENDSFSSFLYNGNLYFNYGARIYKWDGKNVQAASIRRLTATQYGGAIKYLARMYTCDRNLGVASITEKEFISTDATYGNIIGPWGFDTDIPPWANRYAQCVTTAPSNAAELVFNVQAGGVNTLQVGDTVFLGIAFPSSTSPVTYQGRREYRAFEVTFSSPTQIKLSNPSSFYAYVCDSYTGSTDGYFRPNGTVSAWVAQLFVWDTGTNTYKEAMTSVDPNTWDTGNCEIPMAPDASYTPRFIKGVTTNGRTYEFPEFPRKVLPMCKHISQVNGLMFMSCPRVFEGLTTDDRDYDWQSIAWSSENPEDPIETWGGMSAIIGTEDEGRVYCTIPNNGGLVIFKERAIYVTPAPSDGLIEPQKVIGSSVGCKHPESIQECNGILFFYVEGKGVYLFRAGMAQAQEATSGFRGIFKTLTGRATSTHDIKNSRYILNVNGTIFVYDYLLDSWWIWSGFNANAGLEYFEQKVLGVTSDKRLFAVDNVLKDNLGADVAIPGFVLTSWFGAFDNEVDKKLKAFRLWALNGSGKLLVEVFKNFKSTKSYEFDLVNSDGAIDVADFCRAESGHRKFKAIAFKISNATINEDMKITGWALDYEPTAMESKNFEGAR